MKLYSEKVWETVNDDNKDVLSDYKMELESQGKAEKTIYQYMADLKGFLCWVKSENRNKYVLDMKRKDFRKFFLNITKEGASNARINRLQSSIRNLLEYCVMEDDEYPEYQINPMKRIKGLEKKTVREIFFLTDKEINYLISYFVFKNKLQIALWVSLCYDTAARRNEILQISKSDILKTNITNEVIGKRGKTFKLIYSKRTQTIASWYLKQRGEDDVDSLWALGKGSKKHAVKYSTFYDWATMCYKALNEKNGTDYKFGPHVFRHTALERFSDGTHYFSRKELKTEKMDINVLKTIAHHSDISTTQSYLQDKDLEQLEQTFGVNLTK